jgi:hypothetical protein
MKKLNKKTRLLINSIKFLEDDNEHDEVFKDYFEQGDEE